MKSNRLTLPRYPLLLSLAMGLGSAQAAPDMVVVGYGGAGQKAQDVAFFQPFSAQDRSQLIQSEYNGEMARIKVMVDTGNVYSLSIVDDYVKNIDLSPNPNRT